MAENDTNHWRWMPVGIPINRGDLIRWKKEPWLAYVITIISHDGVKLDYWSGQDTFRYVYLSDNCEYSKDGGLSWYSCNYDNSKSELVADIMIQNKCTGIVNVKDKNLSISNVLLSWFAIPVFVSITSILAVAGVIVISLEVKFRRWFLALLMSCLSCLATDIIPSDWKPDWQSPLIRYSGLRSTSDWPVFTTVAAGSTVAQINSAISSCPAGQMVRLGPGTFTVDSQITVGKSNIRIQGDGPTTTILNVTASSGRVISTGAGDLPFTTSTTWDSGYTKGTDSITVGSAASMSVGRLITLTQTTEDPGIVSNNGDEGACTDCSGAVQDPTKVMQHTTIITSISGTTIGLGIPLASTNWHSSQSPMCYIQTQTTRTNIILDGFQVMNNVTANDSYNLRFGNAYDILIQNVWSRYAGGGSADKGSRHVTTLHVGKLEVIDSYFEGSIAGGVESYGLAPYNCTGFWFVNNIFNGVTGIFKPTCSGYGVFAYYFGTNITWNPSSVWLQACIGTHGTHNWGILIEGGIAPSIRLDNIHGSASHITVFRNRFPGYETTARVDNAIAFAAQASNKCDVIAGNILGKTNWHTVDRNVFPTAMTSSTKVVEEYGYTNVSYNTSQGDADTFNTAIVTHNQISQTLNGGTNGGVYWRNGYDGTLQLEYSYIYTSKPTYWGDTNFPSIGPDVLAMCTNDVIVFNPAKKRFNLAVESGNDLLFFTQLTESEIGKRKIKNLKLKAK